MSSMVMLMIPPDLEFISVFASGSVGVADVVRGCSAGTRGSEKDRCSLSENIVRQDKGPELTRAQEGAFARKSVEGARIERYRSRSNYASARRIPRYRSRDSRDFSMESAFLRAGRSRFDRAIFRSVPTRHLS